MAGTTHHAHSPSAKHPASGHHAKPAAPPAIHVKIRNRLRHTESVAGATVELIGAGPAGATLSAVTNSHGIAVFHLGAAGSFTLRVTPQQAFDDDVGPTLATVVPVPARIFRSFETTVTVKLGKIATAVVDPFQAANGAVSIGHNPNLSVFLQPVWIASPNNHSRKGTIIDLIVVHHTGGSHIGGAIGEFLDSTDRKVSAHYLINLDGQIIKLVQDTVAANHAGESFWGGVDGVNDNSIGIEIVNGHGPYKEAQYTALLDLLDRLVAANPHVDANRIVGHSDIGVNGDGVPGRKSSDPGLQFHWTRLEERGLGMIPGGTALSATDYGGFFHTFPKSAFHKGDNDKHHKYGGKVHKSITGAPIQEIQKDLDAIGYSVGTPDGDFGAKLDGAVKMFQEHFFGGTRKGSHLHNGHVDKATAEMIKKVAP